MLQNRLHRILFLTFVAPIIFTFYLFYSNESSPIKKIYGNYRLDLKTKKTNIQTFLFAQEEIKEFLNYAKEIGIDPFLIEPFLIFNYLNEESRTYFLNKNLNPHVFRWKFDFNTFGIKVSNLSEDERDLFLNRICRSEILHQTELDCIIFYGNDNTKEWQLNEKIEPIKRQIPIGFLFTSKLNNHKIHLVPFFLRTNSLWTGKINDTFNISELVLNEGANFHFGRYEELFDDFNLTNPSKGIKIPENPLSFLIEKNSSRLIECDRELATSYYASYSHKDFRKAKFVREALANIYYFKEMMKELNLPFWISSGTLLGWYRQCNVISYTTDVDFATHSRFASEQLAEEIKKNRFNFKFIYIWGIVSNGFEFTLKRGDYRADLFFVYPSENNTMAIFGHTKTSYNRYFYPKFDLCTGQLRGIRLNVPCNTRELLELEYGKDSWKTPVSDWNYISSPQNKGPTEYWPKGLTTFRQL